MADDLPQTPERPPGRSVEDHIDSMRDELVTLVHALNRVHEHADALKVQNVVMVLDQLSGTRGFDNIAWPPQYDETDKSLAWVER